MNGNGPSPLVLATMVAFGLLALAGVVLVSAGPESTQRLGLLFGILGVGITALAALVKAGQAAQNTNGKLDDRIEAGVHRALAARRRGDEPRTPAEIDASPHHPASTPPVDPGPPVIP